MDVLLCVNDSCGLNNCYSIKCNKQQERYCFSRANILTSGDIELNPGEKKLWINTKIIMLAKKATFLEVFYMQ